MMLRLEAKLSADIHSIMLNKWPTLVIPEVFLQKEKKKKKKLVYSSTTTPVHHLAEIDPSVQNQSIELDKGQG